MARSGAGARGHTGKALNSTRMRSPGASHTRKALGRTQAKGSAPQSKHDTVATGHNPTGKSKGGGAAKNQQLQGVASPRYKKRNTRGIPNAR